MLAKARRTPRQRMIVRIGHSLFDALQETSIDSECEVCCALFGYRSDDAVVIDDLEFIQNPHTTANTFGIPVEEYSRLKDEGMIGIFHSHRGDSRPSTWTRSSSGSPGFSG